MKDGANRRPVKHIGANWEKTSPIRQGISIGNGGKGNRQRESGGATTPSPVPSPVVAMGIARVGLAPQIREQGRAAVERKKGSGGGQRRDKAPLQVRLDLPLLEL